MDLIFILLAGGANIAAFTYSMWSLRKERQENRRKLLAHVLESIKELIKKNPAMRHAVFDWKMIDKSHFVAFINTVRVSDYELNDLVAMGRIRENLHALKYLNGRFVSLGQLIVELEEKTGQTSG